MKIALRYFWVLAAFGLVVGTIYYAITGEWTGSMLLWFLGLMPLIVAVWSVRRGFQRIPRAEDDPEAEPSANAGSSLGSFPLVSVWPLYFVLGVVVVGAGLVYGLILVPAGAALIGWAIVGFMRESRA